MADRANRSSGSHNLYVYAVVWARQAGSLLGRPGIDGAPVDTVTWGDLAALTSPLDAARVRPTRANLSTHQEVVADAHRNGPVLPVQFGTVMPGAETVVQKLLSPDEQLMAELLAGLEGKDEYRIKARFLPDVALREVVAANKAVQKLRARVQSAGSDARMGDKMQLGELVAAELEALQEKEARALMAQVLPHILEWEPLDARSDDVPLHAAVLVDRRRAGDLEAALESVAQAQKGRLEIDLVGPLAAWDFSRAWAGAA